MKQIRFNKQSQSGMALIAVLLFLILITIAGAIAVRQSSVDLKLATADQVNTLLLNSSDSVLAHTEQVSKPGNSGYGIMMSQTQGVMGYFLTDPINKIDHQIRSCYRPKNTNEMFALSGASVLLVNGGVRNGVAGICNPNNSDDYISPRGTAMNQIVVRGVNGQDASSDNFQLAQEGEDNSVGLASISPKIQIHSVSVLPALSSATSDKITECLKLPAGAEPSLYKQKSNMTECLKKLGVPATALVEESVLIKDTKVNDEACAVDRNLCTQLKLTTPKP